MRAKAKAETCLKKSLKWAEIPNLIWNSSFSLVMQLRRGGWRQKEPRFPTEKSLSCSTLNQLCLCSFIFFALTSSLVPMNGSRAEKSRKRSWKKNWCFFYMWHAEVADENVGFKQNQLLRKQDLHSTAIILKLSF